MRWKAWACAVLVFAAPGASGALAAADELVPTCSACHGEAGVSQTPDIPSIAGQPEFYTLYQLVFFREGRRKSPEMNAMFKGVSDADLQAVARYVAELPDLPSPEEPDDEDLFCQGARLAEQHICGSCHERDYSGRKQSPRLAGQRADYLAATMTAFKKGERIGIQATMPEVMSGIDTDGINALAYFFAHIPSDARCPD